MKKMRIVAHLDPPTNSKSHFFNELEYSIRKTTNNAIEVVQHFLFLLRFKNMVLLFSIKSHIKLVKNPQLVKIKFVSNVAYH